MYKYTATSVKMAEAPLRTYNIKPLTTSEISRFDQFFTTFFILDEISRILKVELRAKFVDVGLENYVKFFRFLREEKGIVINPTSKYIEGFCFAPQPIPEEAVPALNPREQLDLDIEREERLSKIREAERQVEAQREIQRQTESARRFDANYVLRDIELSNKLELEILREKNKAEKEALLIEVQKQKDILEAQKQKDIIEAQKQKDLAEIQKEKEKDLAEIQKELEIRKEEEKTKRHEITANVIKFKIITDAALQFFRESQRYNKPMPEISFRGYNNMSLKLFGREDLVLVDIVDFSSKFTTTFFNPKKIEDAKASIESFTNSILNLSFKTMLNDEEKYAMPLKSLLQFVELGTKEKTSVDVDVKEKELHVLTYNHEISKEELDAILISEFEERNEIFLKCLKKREISDHNVLVGNEYETLMYKSHTHMYGNKNIAKYAKECRDKTVDIFK